MKAAQGAINSMQSGLDSLQYTVIGSYMHEISRHRLLTKEETRRLTLRVYESDDRQAGHDLIVGNLRLVVTLVMKFQRYWRENSLDLIQEGNFGLVKAVGKFDPHKGVKFSSYAAYWIRAYVLKFIMNNWRMVKIGTTQAQRKLFYRLNQEIKLLELRGIKPDNKVLAQRLGVRVQDVVEMAQRLGNCDLSIEAPVGEDFTNNQKIFLKCQVPGVEEEVADSEYTAWFRGEVDKLSQKLDDRERVILFERLLSDEPRTLNDIAGQFTISRERIRQIEKALSIKLKKAFLVSPRPH